VIWSGNHTLKIVVRGRRGVDDADRARLGGYMLESRTRVLDPLVVQQESNEDSYLQCSVYSTTHSVLTEEAYTGSEEHTMHDQMVVYLCPSEPSHRSHQSRQCADVVTVLTAVKQNRILRRSQDQIQGPIV
jgi:hypothetical protein